MKLIRRISFDKFATIETEDRCQYVKVIDTKTHRKVLVKNPEYLPSKWTQPSVIASLILLSTVICH